MAIVQRGSGLLPWDPFRELRDMRRDLDRLFEWSRSRPSAGEESIAWLPPTDVVEEGEHYLVRMDLPGLGKDDVKLVLQRDELIVRGERKTESEKKGLGCFVCERASGAFERRIRLPGEVDQEGTQASFKKGTLEIRLKKTRASESRDIQISG